MRKILLILIIVLLLILGYTSLTKGIEIGLFKVLSIGQIDNENKKLDSDIEKINTLKDIDYPKKISELKTASDNMEKAKSEYLEYTNLSSDEVILSAMQEKSYTIEFLWTQIGNHATKQGVNLKLEITSSSTGANNVNDLKFTVEGSYIGITNFIYAIENDTELNFRIQNFKLLPYQDTILQATFTVSNIAIQGNTSSQNVSASSSTTATTNSSTNTTNTTTNTIANTVEDTTTNTTNNQ